MRRRRRCQRGWIDGIRFKLIDPTPDDATAFTTTHVRKFDHRRRCMFKFIIVIVIIIIMMIIMIIIISFLISFFICLFVYL